ncbi:cardiolipin synthase [Alkalicoccus daliensis]|uniref:Cardiolipin synthase n=1 Tax=Alkalicoccus daliensis TaxID=745820 RepID=A0A1H0KC17_9BACI|nr:cardiolipin synthase [Alkalicoccus daliensis]SDO53379.1 cardiolipin synthase [Alkalicoccus daliensis]
MRKLPWAAAGVAAWITLDLYFGKKHHRSKAGLYEPPAITTGDASLFIHGETFFEHLLKQIRASESTIYMHFYIFRNDSIGGEILKALQRKAKEGVKVKLLVDWVGARLSPKIRRRLKKSGVKLHYAQKPRLPFLFYSLNERNHRKVTVIDGEHAYVGGFNVGDEYTGGDPKIGMWRDYHLYVQGVAVASLGKQFARDWFAASGEKLRITRPKKRPEKEIPIQLLSTDGAHVTDHFKELFSRAKKSVFIGTPYYIPGHEMHTEVLKLAERGVKVQLLIPKNPDHPLVRDGAFNYIRELLDAGVGVRQFSEGFYHAKLMLIDNKILDISTSNFDMRSFYINHEINCTIEDKAWVKNVQNIIQRDFFTYGEEITYEMLDSRNFWDHTREKSAKLISPWM